MLRGAIFILLAVGLIAPVGYWLFSTDEATGVLGPEQQQMIYPTACRPEPAERTTFLLSGVGLPVALFGLCWLTRRWGAPADPRPRWVTVLRVVAEAVLAVGLLAVAYAAVAGDEFYHLRTNLFCVYPILGAMLFLVAFAALFWPQRFARWVRWTGWAAVVAVAGVVVYASVFDERHPYASSYHFNALYASVVSANQGRVLTVDTLNQYGLYAQLLQPVFKLTGLSVTSFTAVIGGLTAVSYVAVWTGLVRVTRNPWVALFGLLALVFFNWLLPLEVSSLDWYFQYRPLRILFPMLSFAAAVQYHHRPSRWLYWVSLIGLGVGVLWNLDAGLPALVAWVGGRGLTAVARQGRWAAVRTIALDGAAAVAACGAVLAGYVAAVYFSSGAVPDFRQMILFQKTFYVTGLAMLPMPMPGTWVLVGLVYLSGFVFAIRSALAGDASPRAHAAFVLSLLGIALFSYYQGRSHPAVLLSAAWPAVPLAAVLLDELAARPKQLVRPLHLAAAALIVWTLAIGAGSLPFRMTDLQAVLAVEKGKQEHPVTRAVEFIRQHTEPGEEVLIFSKKDGLLHQLTGTKSLARCSYNELVHNAELDEIKSRLNRGRATKVFRDLRDASEDVIFPRLKTPRFVLVAANDEVELWEYDTELPPSADVSLRWENGFWPEEPSPFPGTRWFRWTGAEGDVAFVNHAPAPRRVRLTFQVFSYAPGPCNLTFDLGAGAETEKISITPRGLTRTMTLPSGTSTFRFRCDGAPLVHPARTIVFAVMDMALTAAD